MFPKKIRIKNRENLDYIKTKNCLICGKFGVDPAHAKSVGAGGSDEDVMPLCRIHHSEQHSFGLYTFSMKYLVIKYWLLKNGFYVCEVRLNRWIKKA